ncbi:DEAD/DEAH box helicase [Bacillus sp. 31A1R]|uniref:DEAD/DEAH box helicase n=1 Tax=Robertmurraya mangrovi TaxID=3098077 RepID=A0ABU5J3C4_9BACI|nr:DEAD/DEAH box helicase [Bacillus sp. 31A1R]MDZ5473907.1 DEAD/DEAH box helicase [Bacillus sp. 31A1R]
MKVRDFLSLGLSENIVHKLRHNGIVTPTPIQEQAIPYITEGKDIIAQAQTGTGKTLAFILPILEKIDKRATHVQALIITPTRELALQITEEIEKLIQDIEDVDVLAVYGGQDVEKQLKKLKKNVQLVVGTPGRLLDHIKRETIDLGQLSFLVLDEADQMLHIGFLDEVETIIKETPKSRQTMLFSATIPAEVRKLAKRHMKEAEYIQVEKTQGPAETVKQIAIHTVDRAKQGTLIQLIEMHRPYLAVIFCRTKRRVSKLYEALKSHGLKCDELHGDLSQAKREQVMKRFRDGEIQLLIATDVAARGLDVEGVTHVYNYDIPQDSESYVHRIGRTGRAGMTGLATTLYSSDDRPALDLIERELNIFIDKKNLGNAKVAEGIETKPNQDSKKKQKRKPNNRNKRDKREDRSKGRSPDSKMKREDTPKDRTRDSKVDKREDSPKGRTRDSKWVSKDRTIERNRKTDEKPTGKDSFKPRKGVQNPTFNREKGQDVEHSRNRQENRNDQTSSGSRQTTRTKPTSPSFSKRKGTSGGTNRQKRQR